MTTSECQSGYACDTTQGVGECKAIDDVESAQDDGGCGCRTVERRPSGRGALLGLLALGLLSVRRRRRTA